MTGFLETPSLFCRPSQKKLATNHTLLSPAKKNWRPITLCYPRPKKIGDQLSHFVISGQKKLAINQWLLYHQPKNSDLIFKKQIPITSDPKRRHLKNNYLRVNLIMNQQVRNPSCQSLSCLSTVSPGKAVTIFSRIHNHRHVLSKSTKAASSDNWCCFWSGMQSIEQNMF